MTFGKALLPERQVAWGTPRPPFWFDTDARAILEEVGLGIGDVVRDIEKLADGTVTHEQLLERYFDGADSVVRDGWRAYVRCLAAAIKLEPDARDYAAGTSRRLWTAPSVGQGFGDVAAGRGGLSELIWPARCPWLRKLMILALQPLSAVIFRPPNLPRNRSSNASRGARHCPVRAGTHAVSVCFAKPTTLG